MTDFNQGKYHTEDQPPSEWNRGRFYVDKAKTDAPPQTPVSSPEMDNHICLLYTSGAADE